MGWPRLRCHSVDRQDGSSIPRATRSRWIVATQVPSIPFPRETPADSGTSATSCGVASRILTFAVGDSGLRRQACPLEFG